MSNLRDGGPGMRTDKSLNPSSRGHSTSRGRRGGRGGVNKPNPASSPRETTRLRPTHFLALPLNNHSSLMAQIDAFQKGLFSNTDGLQNDNFASKSISSPARGKGSKVTSSLVGGLDSSILIDPRRLHMTLGVMTLEQDDGSVPMEEPETIVPISSSTIMHTTENLQSPASQLVSSDPLSHSQPISSPALPPTLDRKTVSTALYLLNSLKPRISEILDTDKGVKIPLEVMHALKTEKMWMNTKKKRKGAEDKKEGVSGGGEQDKVDEDGGRDNPELAHNDVMEEKEAVGAGVLYVAPEIKNESVNTDLHKLIQVSDLVHRAFKDAGYLTDTRPLKLHCTIINTSHRKPFFRQPFSYSDILAVDALRLLCGSAGNSSPQKKEGSSVLIPGVTAQERNPSSSHHHDISTSALRPNTITPSSSNPRPKSSNVPVKSQGQSIIKNPPSVSVNLGVFAVEEIQLWVMGSHGPNNEYVNCGGVLLE
ncbi:hypothetical protein BYT27DRAFT_7263259 [Phlegmacium glaucopus]|nr:hypothetical protein BYT27DRAFT_7263259 [Phlegmacium glaucopus]